MPVLSKCLRIRFYIIKKYRFLLGKKNPSSRNRRFTVSPSISHQGCVKQSLIKP